MRNLSRLACLALLAGLAVLHVAAATDNVAISRKPIGPMKP
jgi:hypothetical protein